MAFPRKVLRGTLVTLALSTLCVVGASATSLGVGVLNQNAVRIRESASVDSDVLCTIYKGNYVVIQEVVDDDWYKVEYQSQVGYMASDYVDLVEKITVPAVGYGQVKASNGLNVRKEASMESDRVGTLTDEEIVTIVGIDKGWFKIKFGEDNKVGYVLSDYMFVTEEAPVESEPEPAPTPAASSSSSSSSWSSSGNSSNANKSNSSSGGSSSSSNKSNNSSSSSSNKSGSSSSSSSGKSGSSSGSSSQSSTSKKESSSYSAPAGSSVGQQIASYAQNFLGCRYIYGAAGPSSFDCSGFTMYIYKHFGYSLPHGATAAMNYGHKVNRGEWAPGDLIFFSHAKNGRSDHIGIYIGNGKVIHASTNGNRVRIDTLLSGYYSNFYYTARRVF